MLGFLRFLCCVFYVFDKHIISYGRSILNTPYYLTVTNKLTPENIDRIVDVFSKREEVAHFSHVADYDEITGADYNLSVSTYVEAEDTREKIDIVKLNAEIEEIVMRENELREAIRNIIEEIEVGV